MDYSVWISIVVLFTAGFIFTSFFEWSIHRYVMHRPILNFRYAFQAHAVVHHQTFKADETYHLLHEKDRQTIPMAWWNGPVLVLLCEVPFLLLCLLAGDKLAPIMGASKWLICWASFPAFVVYYGLYEYTHWCMHLPKARRMERSWLFRRLNGHHLLHHRYMHKNFNVVFPLADMLFGTLMVRAKTRFAQARGIGVPDVQPTDNAEVTGVTA